VVVVVVVANKVQRVAKSLLMYLSN